MSDNQTQEDAEKKQAAENTEQTNSDSVSQDSSEEKKKVESKPADSNVQPATPAPVKRPVIGTPIGRPQVGTPVGTSAPTPPTSTAPKPVVGTPVGTPRPTVGSPVGASRPTIGTPVGTARPTVGTPVGTPKPSVGTPVGTPSAAAKPTIGVGTPRPSVSTPTAATGPAKKVESKEEVSRRNFLRGLAALGGLVALAQFGALGPFLQGTVGASTISSQQILDAKSNTPITPSSFSATTQWLTFVYPKTNDPNIDVDTFRQWVIIKLPEGFTAPADLSVTDSSGGIYVGFSRVCLHLWCLYNYIPGDKRMECPCHGSQYVPGSGTYPLLPVADNQPPGQAVEGPASLQTPPNNRLPIVKLKLGSDNTFSAYQIVGQVGCGQLC